MATGIVGVSLSMNGINYFVYKAIAEHLFANSIDELGSELRANWWTISAISLGLFAFGTFIQFAATALGIDYEIQ